MQNALCRLAVLIHREIGVDHIGIVVAEERGPGAIRLEHEIPGVGRALLLREDQPGVLAKAVDPGIGVHEIVGRHTGNDTGVIVLLHVAGKRINAESRLAIPDVGRRQLAIRIARDDHIVESWQLSAVSQRPACEGR